FLASIPLDTATMRIGRRISAIFKDLPGGQMLGPTFDYTHRLLDFSLLDEPGEAQNGGLPAAVPARPLTSSNDTDTLGTVPRVADMLAAEGLLGTEQAFHATVPDITRDPLDFPA